MFVFASRTLNGMLYTFFVSIVTYIGLRIKFCYLKMTAVYVVNSHLLIQMAQLLSRYIYVVKVANILAIYICNLISIHCSLITSIILSDALIPLEFWMLTVEGLKKKVSIYSCLVFS